MERMDECTLSNMETCEEVISPQVVRESARYLRTAYAEIDRLQAKTEEWRQRALKLDRGACLHAHEAEQYGDPESPSAMCAVCHVDLGWWCSESPSHRCDYRQEDGSLDEDSCRHCGEPYERK